jgi:hypothetical protein
MKKEMMKEMMKMKMKMIKKKAVPSQDQYSRFEKVEEAEIEQKVPITSYKKNEAG